MNDCEGVLHLQAGAEESVLLVEAQISSEQRDSDNLMASKGVTLEIWNLLNHLFSKEVFLPKIILNAFKISKTAFSKEKNPKLSSPRHPPASLIPLKTQSNPADTKHEVEASTLVPCANAELARCVTKHLLIS